MTYADQLKTADWQKKRLEIMQRDGFSCKICGDSKGQLSVHHLYYYPKMKVWEYENESLITICDRHHKEIHEMAKVSGIIAFKILTGNDVFDLAEMKERYRRLK